MPDPTTSPASSALIDPRGPRFGAVITSVLLTVVVILGPGSVPGLIVLLVQTLAFAAGSLLGLQAQPWGLIYRRFVRPRLGAPAELEAAEPPRFAQTVGLVFAVAGLAGWGFGLPVLFWIATGFALVAALLNAVFDFCLGCEVYLLGRRILAKPATGAAS
jgi:hypothetical protein